jgi:hypothetical protein
MTGFNLLSNFNDNPESLVRRVRPPVIIPQKFVSTQENEHRRSRIQNLISTNGREDDP